MSVPRTYPESVPCWVGIDVTDLDAATAFYGSLYGWTASVDRRGGRVPDTSEDRWSRRARIRDPFGAEFGISQFIAPS